MRNIFISLLVSTSFYVVAAEKKEELSYRYAIGISIDDAKKLMSKEYIPVSVGALVDEDTPDLTEEQKEKEVRWLIRVKDEGLVLYFNWHSKLIGIRDLTQKKEKK